jgi:hypothetical protein
MILEEREREDLLGDRVPGRLQALGGVRGRGLVARRAGGAGAPVLVGDALERALVPEDPAHRHGVPELLRVDLVDRERRRPGGQQRGRRRERGDAPKRQA